MLLAPALALACGPFRFLAFAAAVQSYGVHGRPVALRCDEEAFPTACPVAFTARAVHTTPSHAGTPAPGDADAIADSTDASAAACIFAEGVRGRGREEVVGGGAWVGSGECEGECLEVVFREEVAVEVWEEGFVVAFVRERRGPVGAVSEIRHVCFSFCPILDACVMLVGMGSVWVGCRVAFCLSLFVPRWLCGGGVKGCGESK